MASQSTRPALLHRPVITGAKPFISPKHLNGANPGIYQDDLQAEGDYVFAELEQFNAEHPSASINIPTLQLVVMLVCAAVIGLCLGLSL